MNVSSLLALVAGNAKLAVAGAAAAAVTAGGGLAVASTVTADNPHAGAGLSHAAAGADNAATHAPTLPDAALAHAHGAGAKGHSVVTPVACDAATNHGQYVSSIARQHPDSTDPGAHGKAVSAAAQSDCGKPSGSGDSTESGDSGDSTDTPDTEAPDDGGTPDPHSTSHPTGKPSSLPSQATAHRP